MLDRLVKGVLARLDANAAAVKAERAAIERERAGDSARDHAGRMLESPEGYSTPPKKAKEDAQKELARARRAWEEKGIPALESFATLMIARERCKEMEAWFREHEAREFERKHGRDVHYEAKPFFDLMFDHGIEPRHLTKIRLATLAIVCDLLRWDGHDPNMLNPDNPVSQVFDIYASRLILKPGQLGDKLRSVSGKPVAPQRHSDPRYYRFDELVPTKETFQEEGEQAEATGVDADELVVSAIEPDNVSPMIVEERSSPPPAETHTSASDHADEGAQQAGAETQMDTPVEDDEYALPVRFDEETIRRIRVAAAHFVRDDPDWDIELQAAASWFHPTLTTEQVIARVEATRDDPRSTPFRYFVDAARTGGLKAGQDAYREATIRRMMFQIVTAPELAQARSNLGIG